MAPKKDQSKGKRKQPVQTKGKRARPTASKGDGSSSTPIPVSIPLGMWEQHHEKFRDFHGFKVILPNKVLDWSILSEYGLVPAMRRLLRDPAWLRLFSLEEVAYKQTTLAFLASYRIEMKGIANAMDYKVSFYAFGRNHRMTMKVFIKAMGLYTKEEIQDPSFAKLPIMVPYGAAEGELWASISREERFRPSKSKASTFFWPSHRLFHHILGQTLNSKQKSGGAVTKEDILPLYSVVNNYRVNVGLLVAFAIKHQAGKKMKGIYVGQMITRILKNLKYWPTQASRIPQDGVANSSPIVRSTFKSWGNQRIQANPTYDAEAPGSVPPPQASSSFSVGSVARLETELVEVKKKQNVLLRILTKLAEAANVDISSCFNESPTREQPPESAPSTSAVLQLMAPQEQFEALDLDALKIGEPYYTSEEEADEDEPVARMDEEDDDLSVSESPSDNDSDDSDAESDST